MDTIVLKFIQSGHSGCLSPSNSFKRSMRPTRTSTAAMNVETSKAQRLATCPKLYGTSMIFSSQGGPCESLLSLLGPFPRFAESRSWSSEFLEGVLVDVGAEMSEYGLKCDTKIGSRPISACSTGLILMMIVCLGVNVVRRKEVEIHCEL